MKKLFYLILVLVLVAVAAHAVNLPRPLKNLGEIVNAQEITETTKNFAGICQSNFDTIYYWLKKSYNGDGELSVGSLNYSSPKTRYLSIPPTAFTGNLHTYEYSKETYRFRNTDALNSYQIYSAPVNLPHNATIENIKVYYKKNNSNATFSVTLNFVDFLSDSATEMAALVGTDSTGIITSESSSSIVENVVDNETKSYSIETIIDNFNSIDNIVLVGVVITYTITSPLP